MILYEKENNGFSKIVDFINECWEKGLISELVFTLIYDNRSIVAKYDTMYETDNGLEMDEKGYEEYNAIVFEEQDTKTLFEITYKTLPKEMYCGEMKIDF